MYRGGSKPLSFETRLQRINQKVQVSDTGCWLWTGTTRPDGYGVVKVGDRWERVHRFVVRAGEIDVVRHKCNVRNCINREHLIIGTQAQNVLDSVAAGTHHAFGRKLKESKDA